MPVQLCKKKKEGKKKKKKKSTLACPFHLLRKTKNVIGAKIIFVGVFSVLKPFEQSMYTCI